MTQANRSAAVMAQRTNPRNDADLFATPPWAVRAMLRELQKLRSIQVISHGISSADHVLEPCAGTMKIACELKSWAGSVSTSDLYDYESRVDGVSFDQADFLSITPSQISGQTPNWIITNPPFNLADAFLERCLSQIWSGAGVALLLPVTFLEGQARWRRFFGQMPNLVLHYSERVLMHPGGTTNWFNFDKAKGRWSKGSGARKYVWCIWLPGDRKRPNYFYRGYVMQGARDKLEQLKDYDDLMSGSFPIPEKFAAEAEDPGMASSDQFPGAPS